MMKPKTIHEALELLRISIYKILPHEEEEDIVRSDSNSDVLSVCKAIELCMSHDLQKIPGNKGTVSLWGLLHWTHITQQKNQLAWEEKTQRKKDLYDIDSWYKETFKDELDVIKNTNQILKLVSSESDIKSKLEHIDIPPVIPGFQSSIRIVSTLCNVQSHEGKVRAWIRQCLNTHTLSKCLAGLMNPENISLLTTYLSSGALMLDADAKEIFVGLTSTLDRLRFSFAIDDSWLESASYLAETYKQIQILKISDEKICASNISRIEEDNAENSKSIDKLNVGNQYPLHVYESQHSLQHTSSHILVHTSLDHKSVPSIKQAIFSIHLSNVINNPMLCELALLDPYLGIPNIVEGCCRIIDSCVSMPKLFSVTLDKKSLSILFLQVHRVGTVSVNTNANAAVAVLNKYLCDLPEALLSHISIEDIQRMGDISDERQMIQELTNLVNRAPFWVKPTLVRLLSTLSRALKKEYSIDNELSVTKLGILFAPLLFSDKNGNIISKQKIMETLISRYGEIFNDVRQDLNARRAKLKKKIHEIRQLPYALNCQVDYEIKEHINTVHSTLNAIKKYQSIERKYEDLSTEVKSVTEILQDKAWESIGCEVGNPMSRLCGGGLLVFHVIRCLFVEHPEISLQIIKARHQQTRSNYPFPLACVYITRMLASMFSLVGKETPEEKIKVTIWPDKWLSWCSSLVHGSSVNPKNKNLKCHEFESYLFIGAASRVYEEHIWRMFEEEKFFGKIFAMAFLLFDRNWTRSGASVMDFNTILAETKCQIKVLLNEKPSSSKDMWEIWNNKKNKQQQSLEDGSLKHKDTVACAHMRRYRVIWPGGIYVRSEPSIKSKRIGARELGDIIETVMKIGRWMKIREVPGVGDNGWLCCQSEAGYNLLEDIDLH